MENLNFSNANESSNQTLQVASKILTTLANATYFVANETLKYVNEQNKLEDNEEKSLTEKILTGVGVVVGLFIGAVVLIACCKHCNKRGDNGRRPIDAVREMGEIANTSKFEFGSWTPGTVSEETIARNERNSDRYQRFN